MCRWDDLNNCRSKLSLSFTLDFSTCYDLSQNFVSPAFQFITKSSCYYSKKKKKNFKEFMKAHFLMALISDNQSLPHRWFPSRFLQPNAPELPKYMRSQKPFRLWKFLSFWLFQHTSVSALHWYSMTHRSKKSGSLLPESVYVCQRRFIWLLLVFICSYSCASFDKAKTQSFSTRNCPLPLWRR